MPTSERGHDFKITNSTERIEIRIANSPVGLSVPVEVKGEGSVGTAVGVIDIELWLLFHTDTWRYQLKSFTATTPKGSNLEIDIDVIRQIPLATIITEVIRGRVAGNITTDHLDLDEFDNLGLSEDANIARLWAIARISGENTNEAIAAHLGIDAKAAARRVAKARAAGLIPTTSQGARR